MVKKDRYKQLEELVEKLGEKETLDAIVKSTSNQDFNETYEFITKSYDLN